MKSLIARSSNRPPGRASGGRPADELDLVTGGRRRHPVDPEAKLAGTVELAIDRDDVLREAGVVDAGDARREDGVLRREDVPLEVLGTGRAEPRDRPGSMAPSISTPVGFPAESWRIWPPAGAAVVSSMRARRKASELAHPAWPSTRLSQMGRSGATASSTDAVGRNLPARGSGPSALR